MEIGSIVETVADFEDLRRIWGFAYPKKGEVLTVASITRHPSTLPRRQGIVLLTFEETPNLVGLSDKTINGDVNFLELLLPEDIQKLLKEPIKRKINNGNKQQTCKESS
jgi:hypothetical protein